MTDADFLRTILNDPGDQGSRLVYADWLEEQGHHHQAEFLRAQKAQDLRQLLEGSMRCVTSLQRFTEAHP
jgi:uncharacterized protein (TIGR02996 family)